MAMPQRSDSEYSFRCRGDHQGDSPGRMELIDGFGVAAARLPEEVWGSTLWLHTSGELVRELYRQLVNRVMQSGETIVLPIHSAVHDRSLQLTWIIRRRSHNEVEFTNRVERTVERDTLNRLTGDISGEADEWVTMCSYCKSIQVAQDEWQSAQEAVTTLRLAERDVLPQLTHGVCPDCFKDVMSELDQDDGKEPQSGQ